MIETYSYSDKLKQMMEQNGPDHPLHDYAEYHHIQIDRLERCFNLPDYVRN